MDKTEAYKACLLALAGAEENGTGERVSSVEYEAPCTIHEADAADGLAFIVVLNGETGAARFDGESFPALLDATDRARVRALCEQAAS